MRIDQIEIENFKGFEKESRSLDSNFTVFAGENGSGKTSILDAVAFVLSPWGFAFKQSLPVGNSIRVVSDETDSGQFREVLPASVTASGAVLGEGISWEQSHVQEAGFSSSVGVSDESHHLFALAHKLTNAQGSKDVWPIIAYYPAHRTQVHSGKADWNKVMSSTPIRPDGYNNWFDAHSTITDIIDWLGRQEAIAFQDSKEPQIYKTVRKVAASCLPNAKDLRFSAKIAEPVIEWEDGSKIPFSRLSHGQRSILAMILDIARRSAMLNPHLAENAPAETPGIVLIDELDLHLHPRWQRTIVDDLKRTFPKIQFIATSHSPFIIQSLEPGELRMMGKEEPKIEYSNRGLEEIVRFIQGVDLPATSERYAEKKAAAKDYFQMLRDGKTMNDPELCEAKEKLDRVTAQYSDNAGLDAYMDVESADTVPLVNED